MPRTGVLVKTTMPGASADLQDCTAHRDGSKVDKACNGLARCDALARDEITGGYHLESATAAELAALDKLR